MAMANVLCANYTKSKMDRSYVVLALLLPLLLLAFCSKNSENLWKLLFFFLEGPYGIVKYVRIDSNNSMVICT